MKTTALPQLWSYGHPLAMDDDKVGVLRSSMDAIDDVEELRRRVDEDGYLFLPGYLNRDDVLKARASLIERLRQQGLLHPDHPPGDAIIAPGQTLQFKPDLAAQNDEVEKVIYSGPLIEFYEKFFGEPVRHYDFTWLRCMGPGKGTNPHCDLPYMGRGTHRHMTCWVPYGDVSFDLGGLMVLEGSHKRMDLLKNYVFRDVDAFCENKEREADKAKNGGWTFTGTLSHDPPGTRDTFGGRWLTTDFQAGDLLTFGMFLVHASTDNRSGNRLRLSSDSRYQRASEPIDDRWVGASPLGHSTAGKRGRIC